MQYRNVIVALVYGMTGTSFTHHPSRTCIEQTQMNTAQPLSSRSLLVRRKKERRLWGRGCFPASPQRKWRPKKWNLGMQGRERKKGYTQRGTKLFNMPGSLSLLILRTNSVTEHCYSYGTNEETKAQRGPVTYPRSHSFIWQKSHLNQACWTAITSYNNY